MHKRLSRYRPYYGFTIVELLIVIVVIGILATITTVAYTGVITTAKNNSAQSSATVIQKKLEAYYSATGSYPTAQTISDYINALNSRTDSSLDGSGITIEKDLDSMNGQKSVQVSSCSGPTDAAAATGYRIRYWDFSINDYASQDIHASASPTPCNSWDTLN